MEEAEWFVNARHAHSNVSIFAGVETEISIGVGDAISSAATCSLAPILGAGNLEGSAAASSPMFPRCDGLVSPTSVCATRAPVCRTAAPPLDVATAEAVGRDFIDAAGAGAVSSDTCGVGAGAGAGTGRAGGCVDTGSSGRN